MTQATTSNVFWRCAPSETTRVRRILVGAILAWGLACRHGQGDPKEALRCYQRALVRGDAEGLRRASDHGFRSRHSPEVLREVLGAHPGRDALAAALAVPPTSVRHLAELVLADGRVVVLIRESGQWKVASGGFSPLEPGSPVAVLAQFFRAVERGHWALVRAMIPDEHQTRLASDEALARHVQGLRPRIQRVRALLQDWSRLRAAIKGKTAELAYGPEKTVQFVLQGGTWRIRDLE